MGWSCCESHEMLGISHGHPLNEANMRTAGKEIRVGFRKTAGKNNQTYGTSTTCSYTLTVSPNVERFCLAWRPYNPLVHRFWMHSSAEMSDRSKHWCSFQCGGIVVPPANSSLELRIWLCQWQGDFESWAEFLMPCCPVQANSVKRIKISKQKQAKKARTKRREKTETKKQKNARKDATKSKASKTTAKQKQQIIKKNIKKQTKPKLFLYVFAGVMFFVLGGFVLLLFLLCFVFLRFVCWRCVYSKLVFFSVVCFCFVICFFNFFLHFKTKLV